MSNEKVHFTIHEGFHEPWKCQVVICLQFATLSIEKSINVFMSVPDNEEVDIYLMENAFVYQQRVKRKNPSILVVL